jgi:RecA-family ATPase
MSQTPIIVTLTREEALARFDRLEEKLETLPKDVSDIRQKDLVGLKGGKAKFSGKINRLSKRRGNQAFIDRGILIAWTVAILGGEISGIDGTSLNHDG